MTDKASPIDTREPMGYGCTVVTFVGLAPLLLAVGSLASRGLHYLKVGEWRSITVLQCLTDGCHLDGRPSLTPPAGMLSGWLRDPHSWIGLHKIVSSALAADPIWWSIAFVFLAVWVGISIEDRAHKPRQSPPQR